MPIDGHYGYDAEIGRRRKAWQSHYAAKGCTPRKAERLAVEKVRRKSTWPPKAKG